MPSSAAEGGDAVAGFTFRRTHCAGKSQKLPVNGGGHMTRALLNLVNQAGGRTGFLKTAAAGGSLARRLPTRWH